MEHPIGYGREELLGVFDESAPFYGQVLPKVPDAVASARAEYERLMPTIPYIGPLQYPLPRTLAEAAVALAVYRALKARGFSVEQAGRVIVDAAEAGFQAQPLEALRADGEAQFTQEGLAMRAAVARQSRERPAPGGWVFDFVEGVPGEFDFGCDFTECGIVKFYRQHGAPELTPYLCSLDFVVSRLQGTGLARTKTLADGADRCDFRFKKGREVRAAHD